VVLPVLAPRDGMVASIDVRAVGVAVVALGGGRSHAGQRVDPRVGVVGLLAPGTTVQRGQPLAQVHAARAADAEQAQQALLAALVLVDADDARAPRAVLPIVWERVGG
jgi:thymidine phosphorylase